MDVLGTGRAVPVVLILMTANVPAHLNTTFFKSIVPNLYQKYPNMNMSLHVYATKIPSVNFTSGGNMISPDCFSFFRNSSLSCFLGINITAWGNVDVNVLTNASSSVTAFTLGVVAWLNGTASISTTGNLTGEVEYIKSNLSLVVTFNVGGGVSSIYSNNSTQSASVGLIPSYIWCSYLTGFSLRLLEMLILPI